MFELNSFQFVDGYIASLWLFRSDEVPSGRVLRCLSREAASVPGSGILVEMYGNHDGVLYSADICPHGVLDTLCAMRAKRPHVVLPFETKEKGRKAGKEYAGGHPARPGL